MMEASALVVGFQRFGFSLIKGFRNFCLSEWDERSASGQEVIIIRIPVLSRRFFRCFF